MTRANTLMLRRRQCLAACLGVLAAPWAQAVEAGAGGAASAVAKPSPEVARLLALADRYFDALLEAQPFLASWFGLDTPRLASRIPMDIVPAEIARQRLLWQGFLAELERIPNAGLADADRITWEVLHFQLSDTLASMEHPFHLLPLDQMGENALFILATAAESGASRLTSVADHEHHLSRLRMLPAWCEQAGRNLREGVRRGIVWPRIIVERLLPMLGDMERVDPHPAAGKNPFLGALAQLPEQASPAERARLTRAYRQVLRQQVAPAVARLRQLLERDYLPHSRSATAPGGAGFGALPGGAAWYAQCVRSGTSTSLSPQEIHDWGLQEVARLRGAMAGIARRLGFEGGHTEFLAWYTQRPENFPFQTEREVLDAYERLNQRIEPRLPELFLRRPQARLEIRPEPELTRSTASDHYNPPAGDGSRPGVFFAVIPDPRRYSTTGMTTLFLHEGQPGHHYQLALGQELPLPRLQRFLGNNAYMEGWALYAETLGYPLGLFEDPNAHLGHLMDAMLRAARLVVDTGLHAQGWSRERAISYLATETGYSEAVSRAQIERYMVTPGQALGYAVGRRCIETARDRARAALGSAFSLPAFHDQVLGSGILPLAVLDGKIDRWIAREQAGQRAG